MKKIIFNLLLLMIIAMMAGCSNKTDHRDNGTPNLTPLPTESMDQEELDEAEDMTEDTKGDQTEDAFGNENKEQAYSIEDFFPFLSNTEYVYEGAGNEYASYNWIIDYFDQDKKRIQIRTNNGGTELMKVIELKDGQASVIYTREEAYYRENLLSVKKKKNQLEVLLKEPISEGTNWDLDDDRKRYISGINVELETPVATYQTVEVTTESVNGTTKDYYVPGVGLVKTLFQYEDAEITSTLSEINKDKPLEQLVNIYYPHQEGKLYVEHKSIAFPTNTVTRIILQEAMQEPLVKPEYLPLISENTMINSLFLGDDGIVYVDFTKNFIDDMNADSEFEALILQGIANTLGTYYGSKKVYLTVDGKPYESGHISFEAGETIRVEMSDVVK